MSASKDILLSVDSTPSRRHAGELESLESFTTETDCGAPSQPQMICRAT